MSCRLSTPRSLSHALTRQHIISQISLSFHTRQEELTPTHRRAQTKYTPGHMSNSLVACKKSHCTQMAREKFICINPLQGQKVKLTVQVHRDIWLLSSVCSTLEYVEFKMSDIQQTSKQSNTPATHQIRLTQTIENKKHRTGLPFNSS